MGRALVAALTLPQSLAFRECFNHLFFKHDPTPILMLELMLWDTHAEGYTGGITLAAALTLLRHSDPHSPFTAWLSLETAPLTHTTPFLPALWHFALSYCNFPEALRGTTERFALSCCDFPEALRGSAER